MVSEGKKETNSASGVCSEQLYGFDTEHSPSGNAELQISAAYSQPLLKKQD